MAIFSGIGGLIAGAFSAISSVFAAGGLGTALQATHFEEYAPKGEPENDCD